MAGAKALKPRLADAPAKREAPAGLYVHVPFCSSICPYCDFAVTKGVGLRGAAFVEGIERELQLVQAPEGAVFDSIYLGGMPPSPSREVTS